MKLRRSSGRQRLRHQADGSGSAASPFSYRAQRSETELNTGRVPQRATIKSPSGPKTGHFWLQRFGLIILQSAAVIVSVINVLTLSTNARIVSLSATQSGNLLINQAQYQAAANQLLRSSIWNHDKITINTGEINRQLLKQFPQLASVSVTIPLVAHRPIIYIQSDQAVIFLTNASGAFALDSSGKVVLETNTAYILGLPGLPVVADQSGLKLQLGHQVLAATSVSFIQTVVAQLAAKHLTVSALTLPAAASELDLQITGQPYIAKFNLENNDPRQQVGTLLATIAQLQKQNITPAKYIDVRIDGRAYYQ